MSTELVRKMFMHKWPRLYLDTAVLVDIGRGLLKGEFVDELVAAVERHWILVIVSHAHFRDALKPGDRDAPSLLASVLERFWCRALVTRGPIEIEPWAEPGADIEFEPCANIREVVNSPSAEPVLKAHAFVQSSAHAAAVTFKETKQGLSSRPKQKLSNNFEAIVIGSSSVLALGLVEDAAGAVEYGANAIGIELTPQQREDLIALVRPAEASIRTLEPLFESITKLERLEMWKTMRVGPENAPGGWIAKMLAANRSRNVGRKPDESDSIDLEHIAHIPYVDIATCDRQAFAAISPHLADVKGPRNPALFRNGQIEELLVPRRSGSDRFTLHGGSPVGPRAVGKHAPFSGERGPP